MFTSYVKSLSHSWLTVIESFHNSYYRTTFSSQGLIIFGVQRNWELVRYGLLELQILSLQIEVADSLEPNWRTFQHNRGWLIKFFEVYKTSPPTNSHERVRFNHGHNFLKPFYGWASFPFTTTETKHNY